MAIEQTEDPELLTIDELAVSTGMTVRTTRYYDSLGLLPPPVRRGRMAYYGPEHLAGLASPRKDALLVALACAVDLNRTARQWWGWLDDPAPAPPREVRSVRAVPTAAEVRRFARAHGVSDDQVWRAVVDLYAGPAVGVAGVEAVAVEGEGPW